MTAPVDIDAIEARAAASTPGPWKKDRGWTITGPEHDWDRTWPFSDEVIAAEKKQPLDIEQSDQRICSVDWGHTWGKSAYPGTISGFAQGSANQDFIISARTDVPNLVAEVRRLRAKLEATDGRVNRKVEAYRDQCLAAQREVDDRLAELAEVATRHEKDMCEADETIRLTQEAMDGWRERAEKTQAECAALTFALAVLLNRWPHYGACCTFDTDGKVIVTEASCRCDQDVQAARAALAK